MILFGGPYFCKLICWGSFVFSLSGLIAQFHVLGGLGVTEVQVILSKNCLKPGDLIPGGKSLKSRERCLIPGGSEGHKFPLRPGGVAEVQGGLPKSRGERAVAVREGSGPSKEVETTNCGKPFE